MHIALVTPKDGSPAYHLYLATGLEHKGSLADCQRWAEAAGLELPTLVELTLIQSHVGLRPTWYWSAERSSNQETLAYAYHGYYHYTGSSELTTAYWAVGVRRVPV